MSDVTDKVLVCGYCGSTNIETDPENEGMWRCVDCGVRFLKTVEPELEKREDWSDTAGDEELEEEDEEALGLLGEPDEW